MLLSEPDIQTLHLVNAHTDSIPISWKLDGQRLPPIGELVLHGDAWQYSPSDVLKIWDWSRIIHLELRSVPIVNFIHLQDFQRLKTFITETHCQVHEQEKASILLCRFVAEIEAPKHLSMRCNLLKCSIIATITKKGSDLRFLDLRDFGLPSANDSDPSTAPTQDFLAEMDWKLLGTNVPI